MPRNSNNDREEIERIKLKLAIVGGGRICKFFLNLLQKELFPQMDIEILGVCDIDPRAEGFLLAREMGIFTTHDFKELFQIEGLNSILELTNNRDVLLDLIRLRPKGIGILEHNIGRLFRTLFIMNQGLDLAEQQVALEREVCRFLIQQANERILFLNPDFTIVEANESFLTAVGKSKDEVVGAKCYEVTHGLRNPCSREHPDLGCPLLETLRSGESAHVLHEHPTPDGEAIYCDMVTYPLKDQTGKVNRVIEIWRDMTEVLSRRLEKRVNEVKANLEKVIQEDRLISLGKLVASSVHEINNPIQGLLTFSHLMLEMLKKGELTARDREDFERYLTLMSGELERCGNIVSGLLSFSRQTGTDYGLVEINQLLRQVITLTRHKMEIQDIILEMQLSGSRLVVDGDENQLQQCLLNLIFNAIEAMPHGGSLNISSNPDKDRTWVVIEIRDTGVGISPRDMNHIFDPFFTTKGDGKGTGMGLAIVYGVIKNHGGRIEVDSKPDQGAAFTVYLPLESNSSG